MGAKCVKWQESDTSVVVLTPGQVVEKTVRGNVSFGSRGYGKLRAGRRKKPGEGKGRP